MLNKLELLCTLIMAFCVLFIGKEISTMVVLAAGISVLCLIEEAKITREQRKEKISMYINSVNIPSQAKITNNQVQSIKKVYVPESTNEEIMENLSRRLNNEPCDSGDIKKNILTLMNDGDNNEMIYRHLQVLSKLEDTTDFIEDHPQVLKYLFAS